MLIRTESKITKEDYDKLLKSSYSEISDYISDIASKTPCPPQGYGFLSPSYYAKDGEYFVSWKHYDSCD